MSVYPILPHLSSLTIEELKKTYNEINRWGTALIDELNTRDQIADSTPTSNIKVVVTISSINRPSKGDIVYSASAGKYKGYVSTAASTTWKNYY